MLKRLIAALSLLCLTDFGPFSVGGYAPVVPPSLTGITLSSASFTCGAAGNIGAITVQGTGNIVAATLSIQPGADPAFGLSATTVPANLTVGASPSGCPTNYPVTIVATLPGVPGSPLSAQFTIAGQNVSALNISCAVPYPTGSTQFQAPLNPGFTVAQCTVTPAPFYGTISLVPGLGDQASLFVTSGLNVNVGSTAINPTAATPENFSVLASPPSLTGVMLSSTAFACGTAGTVGAITVQGTGTLSSATLALTGSDAAQFALSSPTVPSNLTVGSSPAGCPRNYGIGITASMPGATGSPMSQAFTITGSPTANTIGSVQVFPAAFSAPLAANGLAGAISVNMSSGSFTGGSVALSTAGTCAGASSANNGSFVVSGSNLNAGSSSVADGVYKVCLAATLGSATNSPFYAPITLQGTPPSSGAALLTDASGTVLTDPSGAFLVTGSAALSQAPCTTVTCRTWDNYSTEQMLTPSGDTTGAADLAAFNAARANCATRTIRLGAGTFYLASPGMPGNSGCIIEGIYSDPATGSASGGTIIRAAGTWSGGSLMGFSSHQTFRELTLTCAGVTSPPDGMDGAGVIGVTWEMVSLVGCSRGISITGTGNKALRWYGGSADNNASYGLFAQNVDDFPIWGVRFRGNAADGSCNADIGVGTSNITVVGGFNENVSGAGCGLRYSGNVAGLPGLKVIATQFHNIGGPPIWDNGAGSLNLSAVQAGNDSGAGPMVLLSSAGSFHFSGNVWWGGCAYKVVTAPSGQFAMYEQIGTGVGTGTGNAYCDTATQTALAPRLVAPNVSFPTVSATPQISSILLSNQTFAAGTAGTVGTASATLSSGTFSGTFSLQTSGSDHASTTCTSNPVFSINSAGVLSVTSGGAAQSYPGVCVVATQAGATPYVQAFTLTGTVLGSLTIVAHGDSITRYGGGVAVNQNYPAVVAADFNSIGTTATSVNFGDPSAGYTVPGTVNSPGQTLDASAPGWVDPYALTAGARLIIFAGTNDIALGALTGAQTFSAFQSYFNARRAAGWPASSIVVPEMLPRGGSYETNRIQLNSLLASNAASMGYQEVPLGTDTLIGQANQNYGTTYYADGTHPNPAGQAIIASDMFGSTASCAACARIH